MANQPTVPAAQSKAAAATLLITALMPSLPSFPLTNAFTQILFAFVHRQPVINHVRRSRRGLFRSIGAGALSAGGPAYSKMQLCRRTGKKGT
jgi:hypothetical protein